MRPDCRRGSAQPHRRSALQTAPVRKTSEWRLGRGKLRAARPDGSLCNVHDDRGVSRGGRVRFHEAPTMKMPSRVCALVHACTHSFVRACARACTRACISVCSTVSAAKNSSACTRCRLRITPCCKAAQGIAALQRNAQHSLQAPAPRPPPAPLPCAHAPPRSPSAHLDPTKPRRRSPPSRPWAGEQRAAASPFGAGLRGARAGGSRRQALPREPLAI